MHEFINSNKENLLLKYLKYSFLCLYSPFISLINNKELFLSLYKREFKTRTTGTTLGVFWLVGQQALQVVALWFLIDVILQVRFPGETPFLSYFLIGMIPWLMMVEVLSRSASLFKEHGALFKRTVFPLEILPLLIISFSMSTFSVVYLIVVLLLNGWISMLIALAVFFLLGLWLIPMIYFFSILGVFLKDFEKVIPFVLTMLMYLSPILYMPDMIPEEYRHYLVFNPIADLMAFIHAVVLQHELPEMSINARLFLQWLLFLGPVWLLFKRAEKHIRDVI